MCARRRAFVEFHGCCERTGVIGNKPPVEIDTIMQRLNICVLARIAKNFFCTGMRVELIEAFGGYDAQLMPVFVGGIPL